MHAAGLVIRDLPLLHSSWRASHSLSQFLVEGETVAIADIDTRKLTRILRERGAQGGCIATADRADADVALRAARAFPRAQGHGSRQGRVGARALPVERGQHRPRAGGRVLRPGSRLHVVAYDFGIKRNILRLLADYGCRMTVVPAQTSAADALALNPDGIFLSNGPGDPEPCDYAIAAIREFLESDVPIFGICLGPPAARPGERRPHLKMKFGHHGANHPVQELAGGHVLITSQNHGFAVDEASLPAAPQADPSFAVRRVAAGHRAHRPPGLRLPGSPRGEPGPARHARRCSSTSCS